MKKKRFATWRDALKQQLEEHKHAISSKKFAELSTLIDVAPQTEEARDATIRIVAMRLGYTKCLFLEKSDGTEVSISFRK